MDWYRVFFGFELRGYNECEGSTHSVEEQRQLTLEELLYPERYLYPKAIPEHDAACQIDVRSVEFELIAPSAETKVVPVAEPSVSISIVAIAFLFLWLSRRKRYETLH